MTVYYNEHEPFMAEWLRELMKAGLIAAGEVDERSIEDIVPGELVRFTQCHFFAGAGVWSYALRQTGWPDDRPVWTGSCPCQPFSASGKGEGFTDERHLWPAWFHLISQSKPVVVFGEQVASDLGLTWFDLVSTDLESAGYTVGTTDFCAAGVGAPHIRQRLYFVADSGGRRREQRNESQRLIQQSDQNSHLGHSVEPRLEGYDWDGDNWNESGWERAHETGSITETGRTGELAHGRGTSFWHDAEWIYCTDGKYRPVESGTFPLAHGTTKRVGKLRGYGNALCAPVAQAFIKAYMEIGG